MIKFSEQKSKVKLKDPENLLPIIFKCKDCGCVIRKLEETQSYILLNVNKEIELGNMKFCSFCYRLNEYRGLQ